MPGSGFAAPPTDAAPAPAPVSEPEPALLSTSPGAPNEQSPLAEPSEPSPLATPWVIVGPTASGKSALAMELARRHPGTELFCVDSMTVYRRMNIGTAKPTAADQRAVRHHLLDLVEPDEPFSVVDFQQAYRAALADLTRRAHAAQASAQRVLVDQASAQRARTPRALLVGGAGLYVRAVVDNLTPPGRFPEVSAQLEAMTTDELYDRLLAVDPLAASRILANNRRRALRALEVTLGSGKPFSSFGPGLHAYPPVEHQMFGVRIERGVLAQRIEARYRQQVADGFVDEVRELTGGGQQRPRSAAAPAARGALSHTAAQSLGYREIAAHLRGEMTLDEAIAEAIRATLHFARRQQRWFRRDPRITWIDADTPAAMATAIETHLTHPRPLA